MGRMINTRWPFARTLGGLACWLLAARTAARVWPSAASCAGQQSHEQRLGERHTDATMSRLDAMRNLPFRNAAVPRRERRQGQPGHDARSVAFHPLPRRGSRNNKSGCQHPQPPSRNGLFYTVVYVRSSLWSPRSTNGHLDRCARAGQTQIIAAQGCLLRLTPAR